MHIPISSQISLTEFRLNDKGTCVERISEWEISDRTMQVPHPYTDSHFDQWLCVVVEATEQYGEPVHFAIREGDSLIGCIGFEGMTRGHKAEVGYWLAKAWWGRGIMSAVVGKACGYAFAQWKLVRITAHVFESNIASARVLEKNGFEFEGLLRKHRLKNGRFLNSRLFALVQ